MSIRLRLMFLRFKWYRLFQKAKPQPKEYITTHSEDTWGSPIWMTSWPSVNVDVIIIPRRPK